MRIKIAAIGRLRDPPMEQLVERFIKRSQWPIEIVELQPKARQTEAGLLADAVIQADKVLALDERGRNLTSKQMATLLGHWQDDGCRQLVCLIGGADGLNDQLRQKADKLLAFGQATWPHMLARVMLCEQLFRASSILQNHPYHREG